MATNYEQARELVDRGVAVRLSHKEQAAQRRQHAEQAQAYAILALADQLAELNALLRERLPERTETKQKLDPWGLPAGAPVSKGKPCKTCGCDITLHHKLRCENKICSIPCNGWTCLEHGWVLCGCTYSGGVDPQTGARTELP